MSELKQRGKTRTSEQKSDVLTKVFQPASKRVRRAFLKKSKLTKRGVKSLVVAHLNEARGDTEVASIEITEAQHRKLRIVK